MWMLPYDDIGFRSGAWVGGWVGGWFVDKCCCDNPDKYPVVVAGAPVDLKIWQGHMSASAVRKLLNARAVEMGVQLHTQYFADKGVRIVNKSSFVW